MDILRTITYTIIAMLLGIITFGLIGELFQSNDFGLATVFWFGLVYAIVVGIPYSIVLLIVARVTKNMNPLRLQFLIPSVMLITMVVYFWLNYDLSAIKGDLWPYGVAAVAYLFYAVGYSLLVNKFLSK
jgi:hypothetical protein